MYEYKDLLQKVIEDIPKKNETKPFGITFIAAPGMGKSTVAEIISKKMDIYITANDKIRRILETLGIDPEEHAKMVTELANDRTVYMLENNMSMIIDANMEFFWQLAYNNFKKYNAKLYFIKLDCEEAIILKRIEERKKKFESDNPENYSRADKNDYVKYLERKKESTFPSELIFHTINTNATIDEIEKEIDILINKIREENLKG